MRRLSFAFAVGAALLTLAGCAPAQGPAAPATQEAALPPPTMTVSDPACAGRGGEMRQVGRLGTWRCVIRFSDAGRPCTDGAQCQGDCLATEGRRPAPGEGAPGFCAKDSDSFGCRTRVTDGKAEPTICVD